MPQWCRGFAWRRSVAPNACGQQVAGELLTRDGFEDFGSLAFWRLLCLFKGCLGAFHARLEALELFLADALNGQPQRRLLAGDKFVLRGVPIVCAVSGEAANANWFAANAHGRAFGLDFAFYDDLRLDVDGCRDGAGQLAGVSDALGNEAFQGFAVGFAGCHPCQGDFFACKFCRGRFKAQQLAIAPGGAAGVAMDAVFEFGFEVVWNFCKRAAARLHGVGQCGVKEGQFAGFDASLPKHLADGALAVILRLNIGGKLFLVGVQLALQGGGVQVLDPAFGVVDGGVLAGGGDEFFGVDGHGCAQIRWTQDDNPDSAINNKPELTAGGRTAAHNRWIAYNKMRGQYSSALEHAIPEQFWVDRNKCSYLDDKGNIKNPTLPQCQEAISAVKAIAIAQSQGQKIYSINKDNAATALPKISASAEIRNAIQAGKEVTFHEKAISAHGWSGQGYIIVDPETGAGAYLIEGKGNGGAFLYMIEIFVALMFIALLLIIIVSASGTLAITAALTGVAAVFSGYIQMALETLRDDGNQVNNATLTALNGIIVLAGAFAWVNPYSAALYLTILVMIPIFL